MDTYFKNHFELVGPADADTIKFLIQALWNAGKYELVAGSAKDALERMFEPSASKGYLVLDHGYRQPAFLLEDNNPKEQCRQDPVIVFMEGNGRESLWFARS